MKRVVWGLLFLIIFVNFVNATTTCSITSISEIVSNGTIPSDKTFSCSNQDSNDSVTINKVGDFFNLSESTPIVILPLNTRGSLVLNFFQKPVGSYNGFITFSDGTPSIPISMLVNSTAPPVVESGCRLIELPHTTTFRLKQGETGNSGPIKIKVSNDCDSTLIGTTVAEQIQMTKPMFLQGASGDIEPGGEFSFSIGLDGVGVSTGAYSNTYIISGSIGDDIFQKSISLTTIVAVGTSPINSTTFSVIPSCTLDSDMSLNNTYSLICNNANPNLNIEVPYNDFFKGVDVSESEGKIEYKITPVKTGVTDFIALFKYKDFVINNPFVKQVRISAGSVPVQGTTVEVAFYQNDVKKNLDGLISGKATILVKDNNTKSLVPTFSGYLNGVIITNNTLDLQSDKNYELIIDSPGYLSNTLNFTVKLNPIEMTISPQKDFYTIGDIITITTNANASLLLDNMIINSPYTFATSGTKELKAVKEGYTSINKSLDIRSLVSLVSSTPLFEDWKKGKTIISQLSRNSTWSVELEEKSKDLFLAPVIIASGSGDIVTFDADKYGKYSIKSDGNLVTTKTIESKSFLSWNKIKDNWFWWLGGIVVLLVIIVLRKKGDADSNVVAYS